MKRNTHMHLISIKY